jgi:hypothetical protein
MVYFKGFAEYTSEELHAILGLGYLPKFTASIPERQLPRFQQVTRQNAMRYQFLKGVSWNRA